MERARNRITIAQRYQIIKIGYLIVYHLIHNTVENGSDRRIRYVNPVKIYRYTCSRVHYININEIDRVVGIKNERVEYKIVAFFYTVRKVRVTNVISNTIKIHTIVQRRKLGVTRCSVIHRTNITKDVTHKICFGHYNKCHRFD